MDKIIKFECLGHDVEFLCDARDTRSGFAHDAELNVDGWKTGQQSCYYLNRTWEHWRFQSACLAVCSDLIDRRIEYLKREYRDNNGIARIAGEKHKRGILETIENDEKVKFFREIKKTLNEKCF